MRSVLSVWNMILIVMAVLLLLAAMPQEQTGIIAPSVVAGACNDGEALKYRSATKDFGCVSWPGGGAGIPAGSILLVDTGSCPATFTEVAALSGKFLLGTTAAAGDAGATGGSDSVTPAGTVSAPVLTMNALSGGTRKGGTSNPGSIIENNAAVTGTASAPTFTGTPQDNRPAFAKVIFCKKD